jgi:hypothetical protein
MALMNTLNDRLSELISIDIPSVTMMFAIAPSDPRTYGLKKAGSLSALIMVSTMSAAP